MAEVLLYQVPPLFLGYIVVVAMSKPEIQVQSMYQYRSFRRSFSSIWLQLQTRTLPTSFSTLVHTRVPLLLRPRPFNQPFAMHLPFLLEALSIGGLLVIRGTCIQHSHSRGGPRHLLSLEAIDTSLLHQTDENLEEGQGVAEAPIA
jgi:hypothetical protein